MLSIIGFSDRSNASYMGLPVLPQNHFSKCVSILTTCSIRNYLRIFLMVESLQLCNKYSITLLKDTSQEIKKIYNKNSKMFKEEANPYREKIPKITLLIFCFYYRQKVLPHFTKNIKFFRIYVENEDFVSQNWTLPVLPWVNSQHYSSVTWVSPFWLLNTHKAHKKEKNCILKEKIHLSQILLCILEENSLHRRRYTIMCCLH